MNTWKFCRTFTMTAILFGAVVMSIPAFGQQEVDPSWYDPAPPATAAAHSSQQQAIAHKAQQKAKTMAASQHATKAQTKRAALSQTKTSSAL